MPLAAAVKKASGIAVQAVGMIVSPHQAEKIIADGRADFVALARVSRRPALGLACRCGAWRRCRPPAAVSSGIPNTARASRWHAPNRARNKTARGRLEEWLLASDHQRLPRVPSRFVLELIGAISSRVRILGQAARSIGLSASFWVRVCQPSTLRIVI